VIVVQITPGPRFVPLVSRTDAGVYVAQWALAVIVARQFTAADSGHCRKREAVTA
jgi:hypothetical protein